MLQSQRWSKVSTAKFDFHRDLGLLRSRCPTQNRRKIRPHHRPWAGLPVPAVISLAGQLVRQGRDLAGLPRAEIVGVCCEEVAAFL